MSLLDIFYQFLPLKECQRYFSGICMCYLYHQRLFAREYFGIVLLIGLNQILQIPPSFSSCGKDMRILCSKQPCQTRNVQWWWMWYISNEGAPGGDSGHRYGKEVCGSAGCPGQPENSGGSCDISLFWLMPATYLVTKIWVTKKVWNLRE